MNSSTPVNIPQHNGKTEHSANRDRSVQIVEIDAKLDGESLSSYFKTASGQVIFTPGNVSIAFSSMEEAGNNITLGLLGALSAKPFRNSIQNDPSTFTAYLNLQKNNEMLTFVGTEGHGEIVRLSDEELIIRFDTKVAELDNRQDSSKWKAFSGIIKVKNPVITFDGIPKADMYY